MKQTLRPLSPCRLLLLLLLCLAHTDASAFRYGLTGGVNVTKPDGAKMTDIPSWQLDSKSGWFAGVACKAVGPAIGIGFDASLIYSRENFALAASEHAAAPEPSTGIGYLTLPLHLRWEIQIPLIEYAFVPFVFTGPELSLTTDKMRLDWSEAETSVVSQMRSKTKDTRLRYDLGCGIFLFDHVELAYYYTIPFEKSFTLRGMADETSDIVRSNYKTGTHRVGLTLYF